MTEKTIGARLRKARIQQRRTIQSLADHCGLSKAMISRIENGKTMPAIATLIRLTNALGVDLSFILSEQDHDVSYTPEEKTHDGFIKNDVGIRVLPLFPDIAAFQLEPFIGEIYKREEKNITLFHEGEEFIFILEGEASYTISNTTYRLRKGDSIIFDARNQHSIKLISDKVRYINIFANFQDRPLDPPRSVGRVTSRKRKRS